MTIDIARLLEPKEYSYHKEENSQSYHFIVVGAGGTGGYLIPNLARMVSIKNKEGEVSHNITIVDADLIEDKNLLRQQFVAPDIGKNKAEVMAQRYGRSFGLTIGYMKKYIEDPEDLVKLMKSSRSTPVIIDAVDNNKTRLVMKEALDIYGADAESLILSSGNEEYAGQVIFTYKNKFRVNAATALSGMSANTPSLFEIFPTAEIGLLPTELSCAEQAISAPQNIHTNMTAANIIFGYANKLLNFEPIDQLAIFFDTKTQANSIYPATQSGMRDLLTMTEKNITMFDYFEDVPFEESEAVYPPSLKDLSIRETERVEVL